MAYQKQTWREYDYTKTELQNINNGAAATPERLNHMENGIANAVDTATFEQTKVSLEQQLQQKVSLSEQIKGKPNQSFQLISGTVRNTGDGWNFVEDTAHAITGLSTVDSSSYDLIIWYDFLAEKVSNLVVVPDEQLAMKGVICGTSVGKDKTNVRITMPFSMKTKGRGQILEVDEIMTPYISATPLADGSGYSVSHSAAVAHDPSDVVVAQTHSAVGSSEATNEGLDVKVTHTQSSFEVRAYANFHGYVYYDPSSSSFKVDTNNVNKPSVVWDSTRKSLAITHEILNNPYDLNIIAFNSGLTTAYMPVIRSITTSVVNVMFRNLADGSILQTPDETMKIFYSSGNKVLNAMPSDMIVNVRRGSLTLRPSLFKSTAGNLWISGIMEV